MGTDSLQVCWRQKGHIRAPLTPVNSGASTSTRRILAGMPRRNGSGRQHCGAAVLPDTEISVLGASLQPGWIPAERAVVVCIVKPRRFPDP